MATDTAAHLLGRTADEGFGVQDGVQLPQDGGEVGVSLDPGQQVVVAPFLLDHRRRLLGQNADLLVAVLRHGGQTALRGRARARGAGRRRRSWRVTCLFPPAFTTAMMMFSVAMKGSSWRMCLSMTRG